MLKSMFIVMAFVFCFSSQADDVSQFKKYFKFVKDDQGAIQYVKMNFAKTKLSIKPYLEQVKSDLKKEIARLSSKNGQQEVESLINELESAEKSQELDESIDTIRDSFSYIRSVDVDSIFDEANSQGVMSYFKVEMEKALRLLDLTVVASVHDPRYFYKRNVTFEVIKRAINFAKKRLGSVPVLNFVTYVFYQVNELILEQRDFHQNMLLHYLENTDETLFGLTREEADKVFSSIYESKISVINLPESNRAANNWSRYGLNKFYSYVRLANNKLRRSSGEFDQIKQRINFAFVKGVHKEQKIIKNLFHSKHRFSRKMSIAYNYNKPDQIRRFRALLSLSKVGLSFLTLPSWLKGQVESFIDSFYVEQKKLEGALVAYFDITGDKSMSKQIRLNLVNPYIFKN